MHTHIWRAINFSIYELSKCIYIVQRNKSNLSRVLYLSVYTYFEFSTRALNLNQTLIDECNSDRIQRI